MRSKLDQLGPLGFGAAAIGNLYRSVTDEEALETIRVMTEAGVRYFDTAPQYGYGLSETRLGRALAQLPTTAPPIVSTKVGRVLTPTAETQPAGVFAVEGSVRAVFDYSYEGVRRAFEQSLQRLGVPRVNILYAHDLGRRTHGQAHGQRMDEFFEGGYRAMRELKEAGLVDFIGLGVNEWEVCVEALDRGDFDVLLLAGRYTLLEQDPLDRLFPICGARGVRVVIGGPYNSGILATGAQGAAPRYDYGEAPEALLHKVRRLETVCRAFHVPLAAAALQFPLAHPVVSCVIPGLSSAEEARQTLKLLAWPTPSSFWSALAHDGLIRDDAPRF